VEREGTVSAGNTFEFLSQESQAISIAEMNRLFVEEKYNRDLLDKSIATPALPEDWRDYFMKRLHGEATVEP
jgi:MOSC domain-containing protein YiiM